MDTKDIISSHPPRTVDQLPRTPDDGWIDHLRSQADHAQAALLRFFERSNNFQRFVDFRLRWRKCFVNDCDLAGMNTAHALESERLRVFSPTAKRFEVRNIAEDRINRLNAGRLGSVH